LLGSKSIGQGSIFSEDISELVDDVELLEDRVDAVVPADLCLSEVTISVEQVSKLVKGLNEQEFLLPLPLELDAFLVVADHHGCEDLVAFPLGADLEMATAFLLLFRAKVLGLNTILKI